MTSRSLSSSFLFFLFISATHAFDLNLIQMEAGLCPYTVVVTTSCGSPETTRDQISLTFGDAEGNQVYAPRLGGSVRGSSGRLGKCSTDTFQVRGQCLANPICSLYIYLAGPDGWIPETVEVYSQGAKSVKFDFTESDVPLNTWYGHNRCNTTRRPSSPGMPQPEFPPAHYPPATPGMPQPEFPPETPPAHYPPATPEYPPAGPEFPPPPPLRPSAASRLGSGESAFLGFSIATAVAIAAMVC